MSSRRCGRRDGDLRGQINVDSYPPTTLFEKTTLSLDAYDVRLLKVATEGLRPDQKEPASHQLMRRGAYDWTRRYRW